MPRSIGEYADEKVAEQHRKWRERAERHKLAVSEAKLHVFKSLQGGPRAGEQACSECDCEMWCAQNVWKGLVLPCQPQDELPIAVTREASDYVSLWAPANQTNVMMVKPRRERNLIDTPVGE